MLTEHTVAEAARAAGLRAPVLFFEVTGSTNQELLRRAEEGAPDWTLAVALHQEAGRGRLGRTWVSAPGASLLASVLVRPDLPPERASLVALAAGASLALACRAACGVEVRCKWPNDLVVEERKLAGILVEAKMQGGRLMHAVIGSGVNLTQGPADFPSEIAGAATSVAIQGGRADPEGLLTGYLSRLRTLIDASEPPFARQALAAYRELCDTIGRTVRAMTTAGREVRGRAVQVGDSGELLVETDHGIERVAFGEVAHLG